MMKLADSPLFTEYMDRATADALTATRIEDFTSVAEGIILERFGSFDEELSAIVPNIIKLSPPEFTSLLMLLSREELIDQFTEPN
jgi:hypothetical protein